MFNENDQLFIDIILKNSDEIYECMKKSLEYKLLITPELFKELKITAIKNGVKTTPKIIPIGTYLVDKQEFTYYGNYMNEILEQHLYKYDIKDLFGTDSTIKKLFTNVVKIENKDEFAIPSFIAMMNPAYNLVSFMDGKINNEIIYILVNFGYKDNFDYNKFLYDMNEYKIATSNKHMNRQKNKKKNSKK